jgi:AraC-like DNA-binding protein
MSGILLFIFTYMKPAFLKIATQPEKSFSVRIDKVPYFFNQWHYHPELELTLIRKGSGTRLVGDSVQHFSENDLTLVGSNLPHLWRSDELYFREEPGLFSEAAVIHFREDLWGKEFLALPEMRSIRDLLDKARRGLKITGYTRTEVSRLMDQMLALSGPERLIMLLSILNQIALSQELEVLSGVHFGNSYQELDAQRINQIYSYTLNHFSRPITLEEIAAVASISPYSFCRYFKSKTRKTFFQFLNEIRIGHARKLLMEDKFSVSQIALESGFPNLAYFNRKFKEVTQLTPMKYRQQFK